jgi:hypothetical protein
MVPPPRERPLILLFWLACTAADPVLEPLPEPAPTADPAKAAELRTAAQGAWMADDFATCADRLGEALKYGPESQSDAYNAACCNARAGRTDEAFARLQVAVDLGYHKHAKMTGDPELESLRGDSRWEPLAAKVKAAEEAWLATINRELYEMFNADQADRKAENPDWDAVSKRDAERRARVDQILAAGGAKASIDWYHAAMVYQHGSTTADAWKAHELATKALSVEPVHEPARWLAAAAEDRALMREGKPQKWGTQFVKDEAGKWVVHTVDATVTDEERAKWNVPPLAEAQKRAEAMNR